MRCAYCWSEIEVGDRVIRARPSEFMGAEDDGFDEFMADLFGGVGGEIVYCEDCTQDGGRWKVEIYYGSADA